MTTYYISNAGSDSNNGLSEGAPFATVAKVLATIVDNRNDSFLFKRGDVWDESFGRVWWSGVSKVQPLTIGSYGTSTERPMFTSSSAFYTDGGGSGGTHPYQNYVVFRDLDFYHKRRDPNSPSFDTGSANSYRIGMHLLRGTVSFIIDNCKVSFFSYGISVQDGDGLGVDGVEITNCVIVDNYSIETQGHSSGIYFSGASNSKITDTVFDHNGYNEQVAGSVSTKFNHNVYSQNNNDGLIFERNMGANASSICFMCRSPGDLTDNVAIHSPISFTIGGTPTGGTDRPMLGTARGNLALHGSDMDTGDVFGWGYSWNLIEDYHSVDNIAAIEMSAGIGKVTNGSPTTTTNFKKYKWTTSAEDDAAAGYANPNKTIADFDSQAGGPGTFENFYLEIRKQNTLNPNTNYLVTAVLDYFRANYAVAGDTAPVIGTLNFPEATVGVPYSYFIPSSGQAATSYAYATGSDTNGISLNTTTGEFSGTPTSDTDITGISVTASNAFGTSTASNTDSIVITQAASPPVMGTLLFYTATVGQPYYYKVPTSGDAATSFAYATGADANGITLNTATGEFTGTPIDGTDLVGISVTASNAAGTSSASNVASITVGEEVIPEGGPWTFFDPTGNCTYRRLGGFGELTCPPVGAYEYWTTPERKTCPRLRQSIADSSSDFDVEIHWGDQDLENSVRGRGLMLEVDNNKSLMWIYYNPFSNSEINLRVIDMNGDTSDTVHNKYNLTLAQRKSMRLTKTGSTYTCFVPGESGGWVSVYSFSSSKVIATLATYFKAVDDPYTQQIDSFIVNGAGTTGLISDNFTADAVVPPTVLGTRLQDRGVSLAAIAPDTYNTIAPQATDLYEPPDAVVGVQYSYSLDGIFSGGTTELYALSGSLPPGLILNGGTGIISGVPTEVDGVSYSSSVVASNSFGSAESNPAQMAVVAAAFLPFMGTRVQGLRLSFIGNQKAVYQSSGFIPEATKMGTRAHHGLGNLLIALSRATYDTVAPDAPVLETSQTFNVTGSPTYVPGPGLLTGASFSALVSINLETQPADGTVVLDGLTGGFTITHNTPGSLPDSLSFSYSITAAGGTSNSAISTVNMESSFVPIKDLVVNGVVVSQVIVGAVEVDRVYANGVLVFDLIGDENPQDTVAQIGTFNPPNGIVGRSFTYDTRVLFSGTVNSYAITGVVPPGLVFDTLAGTLTGVPSTANLYGGISVTAIGANNSVATPIADIEIAPASTGDFSLLQDIVNAMAPGDWYEIPSTQAPLLTQAEHDAIVAAEGGDPFWNTTSSAAVIKAWNGAANNGSKWWFWGGGHADYGGNELYEFDIEQLSWLRLNDPAPLTGEIISDYPTYPAFHAPLRENGPAAVHTYDAIIYDPVSVAIWVYKSDVVYCANGYGYGNYPEDLFWKYDLVAGTWGVYPSPFAGGKALTCWDPVEQKVVLHPRAYGSPGPMFMDGNANATKIGASSKGVEWGLGVYNPIDRAMTYIDASWWIRNCDLTTDPLGSPVNVVEIPQDFRDLSPSREFGADYDTANSVITYYGNSREVVTFNPATLEMRMYLNSGSPIYPTNSSAAVYSKFIYVEAVNAYLLYNDETRNVYVYKLGGGSQVIDPTIVRAKIGLVEYTSIGAAAAAAVDGDTIDIQPGSWNEGMQITAPNVTINGHGTAALTGTILNKGIIVVNAPQCTIINLELSGAYSPSSGNASGVRLEPTGDGCLIKDCYIHNCQDGVLTSNTSTVSLTMEDCLLDAMCEFVNEEGQQHCIYIGIIDTFTATRCTFHNTLTQGHNFKCRARVTRVTDCDIYTGTGRDSRSVDLPHAGDVLFTNCLIGTNDSTVNPDMIGFGQEINTPYHPVNIWKFVDCTLITDNTSDPVDYYSNDICFRLKATSPALPNAVAENCTIVGTFRTDLPEFQIGDTNDNCYFPTRAAAGLPAAPDMSFTKPTCTAYP